MSCCNLLSSFENPVGLAETGSLFSPVRKEVSNPKPSMWVLSVM
jgi:hypothetical protein